MSWLYSQALVEEYLGGNFLDGEQSAPLNGSLTPQAYCAPDKMMDFSRLSRFGMTFKPLTANLGEELLTLYLGDFHAPTFQQQEKEQELMEKPLECGEKWHASFAKYDPNSSLWRTHQCSLLGDLEEFLETWPRWGSMRTGECWEQTRLDYPTGENEFGSWLPTRHKYVERGIEEKIFGKPRIQGKFYDGVDKNESGLRSIFSPGLCRAFNGLPGQVDRLKAIGNAQVPRVAAAAWRILSDI